MYSMDRIWGIVTVAFTYVFVFSTHGIHDVKARTISSTEDHVFEVNKTYYEDDVYDCVDFYKQPAFDHPLLANHTFHHEMRPSSTQQAMSEMENSVNMEFKFKAKNCPDGTVPIRRITEEDRMRERLHIEKYGSPYKVLSDDTPGIHYATVKTKWSATQKYNGAGAKITTWNPYVHTVQYSSAQVVIRNGKNNIQTGWTVNPLLYGDNRTRLFIYTSAGATQCFNTRCPGFVQVSQEIAVDNLLIVSKEEGPLNGMLYLIMKDPIDGNWWLQLINSYIGFWPKNLFTDLADVATSAEWGGQVYSPPGVPSPPMGSGKWLTSRPYPKVNAVCGFVKTIDESHKIVDALDIDTYADSSRYEIRKAGNLGAEFENSVEFGGPGGEIGN